MRIIFENVGYVVSEAGTLAQAKAATTASMPDVILLDLTLPDGSGLDLLAALAPRTAERPVIVALTGHDEAHVVQECRALGCHAVMLKPAPPRELVKTVGTLLG